MRETINLVENTKQCEMGESVRVLDDGAEAPPLTNHLYIYRGFARAVDGPPLVRRETHNCADSPCFSRHNDSFILKK